MSIDLKKICKVDTSGRRTLTDEVCEKYGCHVKERLVLPNGMTMAIIEKKEAEKPDDAKEKVIDWFEQNCNLVSAD